MLTCPLGEREKVLRVATNSLPFLTSYSARETHDKSADNTAGFIIGSLRWQDGFPLFGGMDGGRIRKGEGAARLDPTRS